jgi:hypothetical protein
MGAVKERGGEGVCGGDVTRQAELKFVYVRVCVRLSIPLQVGAGL